MNKILKLLLLCILTANVFAQEPISVSYKHCTKPMSTKLMMFQEIQYIEIQIQGIPKGKGCNLIRVDCKDGKQTYNKALRFQAPDSAIVIEAFAQSIHPDTVKTMLSIAGMPSVRKYPVTNCKQHILMETLTDKTQYATDTIPLLAYTSGKKQDFTFEGKTVSGIDYCKVRYSKTNPAQWSDLFGLTHYFYYILCTDPE